jgi:hypothetical protein
MTIPTPSDSHSASLAASAPEPGAYGHIGLRAAEWGEQTVTVVAVSMAVLIVAVIAVLMGMT